jgi:hypothetical protein
MEFMKANQFNREYKDYNWTEPIFALDWRGATADEVRL